MPSGLPLLAPKFSKEQYDVRSQGNCSASAMNPDDTVSDYTDQVAVSEQLGLGKSYDFLSPFY